jgi:hypothetical protein
MQGSLERTAIEYTYWFDDLIVKRLNDRYYPNFLIMLESSIKEVEGVECVNLANNYVVFVIDCKLSNNIKEIERIANSVVRFIEKFITEFFSID